MYQIEFSNSKDKPVFVQVDPWACLYQLKKGDSIRFAIDDDSSSMFSIDEHDEANRILTLECDEFFVLVDGKRIHWSEYQSNF